MSPRKSAGRIVSTPVERGTRVSAGAALVQIADTEVRAQADEAAANAAQIEARLGLAGGATFEIDRVPEVANARASSELAQVEFDRARMLVEKKLLPQAEFDRSRAQADVARRQSDIARNGAEQQYQSLLAARARMTLARKALADTVVRAPFDGVVDQRLVSVGDYVVRGTKVASVMRTTPLRVELTVPGQYISTIAVGRSVSLEVDAYPGRTFTGRIRYVSPAVQADSRALIIEAVVPNETGELKPGQFATARIEQAVADTRGARARQRGPHRFGHRTRLCGVSDRVGGGTHRHHRSDGGRPDRDHQWREGRRRRGHQQRRAARRRRAHHAGRGSPPCSGSPLCAFAARSSRRS